MFRYFLLFLSCVVLISCVGTKELQTKITDDSGRLTIGPSPSGQIINSIPGWKITSLADGSYMECRHESRLLAAVFAPDTCIIILSSMALSPDSLYQDGTVSGYLLRAIVQLCSNGAVTGTGWLRQMLFDRDQRNDTQVMLLMQLDTTIELPEGYRIRVQEDIQDAIDTLARSNIHPMTKYFVLEMNGFVITKRRSY